MVLCYQMGFHSLGLIDVSLSLNVYGFLSYFPQLVVASVRIVK